MIWRGKGWVTYNTQATGRFSVLAEAVTGVEIGG